MKNSTFVVVGSGPSLTDDDCLLIEEHIPHTRIIATNESFIKFHNGCHIFIGDNSFFRNKKPFLLEHISEKYSWVSNSERAVQEHPEFNIQLFKRLLNSNQWCSGSVSIEMAISLGASKIILLGADCSLLNGVHWHGLHKGEALPGMRNPTATTMETFKKAYTHIANYIKQHNLNIDIVNCSRYTELECFRKGELEEEL